MDAEQKALLPCPFCGSEARFEPHEWDAAWQVICNDPKECDACVTGPTQAEAARIWNTRALQAQPAEGGVGEGFVLVPVEPTEAMKCAGVAAFDYAGYPDKTDASVIYAAMLAAAPKPATTTGEGVGSCSGRTPADHALAGGLRQGIGTEGVSYNMTLAEGGCKK